MAKAAWLVDMGYLVKTSGKGLFKIDYVKAAALLSARLGDTKPFIFNGYDSNQGIPAGLHGFYHAMEAQGMTICLHPMAGDAGAGTHVQRRVDVDIAAHLVWQCSLPSIENVILTTGDQDFIPAIELVKREFGKRILLFTFNRDVAGDLRKLVDEHLLFEDYKNDVARN